MSVYNGWCNRETWAATLYFDNLIENEIELLLEDYDFSDENKVNDAATAFEDRMNSFFEEQLEQYNMPNWIKDFLTLNEIMWQEIFMAYYKDYIEDSIEDLDGEDG